MSIPQPPSIRDLGIPVKAVNWVRLHPGKTSDGKPSLLASMGQNNGGPFVIDIDVKTGHCRQFLVPESGPEGIPACMRSLRTGILWMGTAWNGHLYRYDPEHSERGLEDLGAIDPETVTFPTGITNIAFSQYSRSQLLRSPNHSIPPRPSLRGGSCRGSGQPPPEGGLVTRERERQRDHTHNPH